MEAVKKIFGVIIGAVVMTLYACQQSGERLVPWAWWPIQMILGSYMIPVLFLAGIGWLFFFIKDRYVSSVHE